MSWQDILLLTSSSDTRCIYFILSLFMTSFFTRPNTIHQSMIQSFQPTPSVNLFFKAIIALPSWSGAGLPSLHVTPRQLSGFSLTTSVAVFCLFMQSATLYRYSLACIYVHLFLPFQSAIFHSFPSTYSTRHHHFTEDTDFHQSCKQNSSISLKVCYHSSLKSGGSLLLIFHPVFLFFCRSYFEHRAVSRSAPIYQW